jgi:predicted acylesterase/phospholipase RssA
LRRYTDEPVTKFSFEKDNSATSRTYLALSGGGADGAYGVGVLNGWSAAGRRPAFSVVSGVSTGGLIAPFAFLDRNMTTRSGNSTPAASRKAF